MTEVSAWTTPVRPRDLSADELHGLDGLRAALAEVVDRTQPGAVSWLWDRTLAASEGGPAPAGFVEAVAAAIGDLLAIHLPDVHWAVWPGPEGATLGVASGARPLAPVLPFVDAHDRWAAGTQDWLHDYLARAAAYLVVASPLPRPASPLPLPASPLPRREAPLPRPKAPLPRQHRAPDDDLGPQRNGAARTAEPSPTLTPAPAVTPEPATVEPATVEHAEPQPAAPVAPAEPLELFARDTLDHAMSLLRETGAFDGDVLVVLIGPGGRRTDCCSGETQEALARAREMVRSSDAGRAALVWVDRNPVGLPGAPQRFPAVVVDAWDGGDVSIRLAHRFVDDVLGTDPIGEVVSVGPAHPLR